MFHIFLEFKVRIIIIILAVSVFLQTKNISIYISHQKGLIKY